MQQDNAKIQLNNELHLNKFKLVFKKVNMVELLCQTAQLPGVSSSPMEIGNPINKIYKQGTKVNFDPLTVTFKVDENLMNYKQLYHWFVGIHFPQAYEQFEEFQKSVTLPWPGYQIEADATLFSLTNAFNPNIEINFRDLFPIAISPIDFALGTDTHATATATFQYNLYTIDGK